MKEHPITPPSELMQQWWDGTHSALYEFEAVVTQAARWGADQELEECCKAIADQIITGVLHTKAFVSWPTFAQNVSRQLHAARRPKPSLKGQALQALANANGADHPVVATVLTADQHALIRRALESLPD